MAKLKGETLTDDKTMIMECVIQLVSNLPSNSKLRVELTNTFLGELWYSLEHPPSLYVGEKYQYRQADGSNNVGGTLLIRAKVSKPSDHFRRTSCSRSSARPARRMPGPSTQTSSARGPCRTPASSTTRS
jgi:hypothetical protein